MIIDLHRFIETERPFWMELEAFLERLEKNSHLKFDLQELQRFHYLYEKVCSDLNRVSTFASEPELRGYLESLVSRAYGEIYEERNKSLRFTPVKWFFHKFPATFQRHLRVFLFSLGIMLAGAVFGSAVIAFDPDSKDVIMPFSHLLGSPKERVAKEESSRGEDLKGGKTTFSSLLMTHNIKVSILAMALGLTWGFGTLVLLFYNGVILGAVAIDYIFAGETVFLFGWLLPHGVIEIPAILIAGQAGLLIGKTLIGRGSGIPLRRRIRAISEDLSVLIFGAAILLVWAGIVEAFLSQYHEPVIPYSVKILFGLIELAGLILLLMRKIPHETRTNR